MLKGILLFGLTRRAIILLGLLVFIAAGLVAFTKLNIEAYPNPAPVILEITAQAAGLSAEEMEKYYTMPMEVGLYSTPGHRQHPLDLVLRPVVRAGHVQVRRRLLLRLHAGGAQPAAEREPSGQPGAADPAIEPGRRGLPLPGGRAAAFRPDQSAHRAGLDRAAPPLDRSRRGAGQQLGRHHQGIRGRGRSRTSSRPTASRCRSSSPRSATPTSTSAAARSPSASNR